MAPDPDGVGVRPCDGRPGWLLNREWGSGRGALPARATTRPLGPVLVLVLGGGVVVGVGEVVLGFVLEVLVGLVLEVVGVLVLEVVGVLVLVLVLEVVVRL